MNTINLIKNKFSFLIDNKFKFIKREKNSEIQVIFKKEETIIELFIETYNESISVVITANKQRKNIFDYDFFDAKYYIKYTANMGLFYKISFLSNQIQKHFII